MKNKLGVSLTTLGALVLAFGVSFGATAANATTTDDETTSSIRIATVSGSSGILGN